eukprot:TRINITY_DN2894_c1_g2_i4.p1 TRINITY_DN2894_c1_g2~~TRINITY_DN2894_c1_g2_i4.p1  ORF type:complete len:855 (-),score=30.47 TRINITY_DN2894_c1_g2_i4:66-2630(-)
MQLKMFLSSAIKDYIEYLNNIYDSVPSLINFVSKNTFFQNVFEIINLSFLVHSFIYFLNSLKFCFFYLITFQWIQDFLYVPIFLPKMSLNQNLSFASKIEIPQINQLTPTVETLKAVFPWEITQDVVNQGTQNWHLISNEFQKLIFENSSLEFLNLTFFDQNPFFIGFINSLFICLPVCSSHFICIRSLLIHGPVVGFFSFLGLSLGNLFFLMSVLYGYRWIILPWFSLEPINYIFGFFLMIIISYNILHEKKSTNETFSVFSPSIKSSHFSKTQKNQFDSLKWNFWNILRTNLKYLNFIGTIQIKYFFLLFTLVWTEQSILFPFLANLNLGISSTVLNGSSSLTSRSSILTHLAHNSSFNHHLFDTPNFDWLYFFGLFIGFCFFSVIIGSFLLYFSFFIPKIFNITYSSFIQKCNFFLILFLLTFSFSSIPYYGMDYLFLGPLGFVPNEKSIETIVPNNDFKDDYRILGGYSTATEISLFDSANYLLEQNSEKMKMEQNSFEELNYQAEYMWTTRSDRIFRIYQRTQSEFLKKITNLFAKPINETNDLKKYPLKTQQTSTPLLPPKMTSIFRNNLENRLLLPEYATILSRISKFSFNNMFFQNVNISNNLIQARFKQKYYSNPIYFNLLNLKIDTFLSRLPKNQVLNTFQETDLFQKRIILSNYYDSINFYKLIPYYLEFQEMCSGSKSFAHRAYQHQFKGTLKNIQKLTFEQNSTTSPLILVDNQTSKQTNQDIIARDGREAKGQTLGRSSPARSALSSSKSIKFDIPLYKNSNNIKQNYFHEELFFIPPQITCTPSTAIPPFYQNNQIKTWKFLNLNPISPFYIGWNDEKHLFMLSNQFKDICEEFDHGSD